MTATGVFGFVAQIIINLESTTGEIIAVDKEFKHTVKNIKPMVNTLGRPLLCLVHNAAQRAQGVSANFASKHVRRSKFSFKVGVFRQLW